MLNEYRNCGIEVEFGRPDDTIIIKSLINILQKIDRIWHNYDEVKFCGFFHEHDFHLTLDGSVSGLGSEFQTRPFRLYEEEFITTLQSMLIAIQNFGGYIDHTCGLHVHISALDFDLRDIRNLITFFGSWNHVLYSIVAPYRLSHIYCRPISQTMITSITKCIKVAQLQEIWDGMQGNNHYLCLNLDPWFNYRHYEVRMCHGLLNPQRILNWVNLQLHIAQYIKGINNFIPYRLVELATIEELHAMLEIINFPEAIRYFTDEYNKYEALKEKSL